MSSEFQYRDKIPVSILGATGAVGQRFVELLVNHPWFEIVSLAASERSVGKPYGKAVNWLMGTPLPHNVAEMVVERCQPGIPGVLAFSALDSSVATEVEHAFEKAGVVVVSNTKNHRMEPMVPLLIPEVNADHLDPLLSAGPRKIVTNPNCSAIGLCIALKPLFDAFGLEAVNVVTMQAISGAGYPGIASLDIVDNVIPYICGEEEKLEAEPLKIFGEASKHGIKPASFAISAHCNRVAVTDGHTACVSVKLKKKTQPEEMVHAWQNFTSIAQELQLPMAPHSPICYFQEERFPQPKLHRHLDKGMMIGIGRLRPCPLFDYKFTILSHNTIRGAAGGAILCAELLVRKGYIFW